MLDIIEKICSIVGNCVTFALGCAALLGFLLNRDKISLFFRCLRLAYLGERAKCLKESLGRIERLNYESKLDRSEIFALFGQVNGQLQSLIGEHDNFEIIRQNITSYLENPQMKRCFSEPKKREIVHSIYSTIDACEHESIMQLPKSKI